MPKATRKNMYLDRPSMHEKYPVSVMDQIGDWMEDMGLIEEKILRKYVRNILIENVLGGGQDMRDLPDYAIEKPVDISAALMDPQNTKLRQAVYDITEQSYAQMEGGNWFASPDDLMQHNMNAFWAHDLTGDGLPNVVFAGWVSRRSSYGIIKTSISGTDGDPESIAFYKKEIVRRTREGIAFHEVSGAPAAILMKAGLEAWDEETINRFFPKPKKKFWGKHPMPNDRDAKNAEKYGGKYDKWFGRDLKGQLPIVKLFFGKVPQ